MKDLVGIFDVADRIFRKRFLNAALEFEPFILPVKIVRHEEAAAQAVFAEQLSLCIGESPLADLDGVEPRPIVGVAFLEVHWLFHAACVYAGQAAHGLREMAVGAGIILGPERDALMPFGVAPAITIERSGGKHEAGENELGALLPVRREFEGEVLDSIELAERPLKGAQAPRHSKPHAAQRSAFRMSIPVL